VDKEMLVCSTSMFVLQVCSKSHHKLKSAHKTVT